MRPASGASGPDRWTPSYIAGTCALSVALGWVSYSIFGLPPSWRALAVLVSLGILAWWQPTPTSDGRSHFTADNVIVLAAIPIAGPLGAGLVGASMAMFARRRIPARRRLFNAAMTASAAMTGGLGYALVGGTFELEGARGALFLITHVGLPIVVADLFNLGLNALLLAGVLRLSSGVPMRLQLRDMLTSTGPTQFAYGVIALLLVVLWTPADLGPVAVLIVMAPLLGARWALLQYGEERAARERALEALVSAIETRAPELEGHSARVSALAALMAQELGLGPKEVADVRTAGLLHDLGRVVVAPGTEGEDEVISAELRGASMLRELPFLRGASSLMEEVARVEIEHAAPSLAAELVRVADEYDLLRHGARPVETGDAIERLRTGHGDPQSERVFQALARALRDQDYARAQSRTAP